MTDYRELSKFEQGKVDAKILNDVEPKHHVTVKGLEFDEPQYTLDSVHSGNYCAECLCVYYNCLCSHEN